jgi:hypothetical protein
MNRESTYAGIDCATHENAAELPSRSNIVSDLRELIRCGHRFPTIYADPPWDYDNRASRGAAVNHYPTMSIDKIRSEPVRDLAAY